jgi:hypothetical protein
VNRARGARGPERGAMALIVMLASVLLAILGMAGAVAFAAGAQAARAQNAADAVAHDVEVQLLRLPPWAREDISQRAQANAGSCAVFIQPPDGEPAPDGDCEALFTAARRSLALDTGGQAELLGLVISADARDFGNGLGTGRVEAVAFVALRRHLPGCGSSSPPAIGTSDACWAQAQAAAHAA